MYSNQVYYTVTESNIREDDSIGTQNYTYFDQGKAYAKLYSVWAYAADKPADNPAQCMSVYMVEHRHDRNIMLESKVFDYRQPGPAPEPEPEPEPN